MSAKVNVCGLEIKKKDQNTGMSSHGAGAYFANRKKARLALILSFPTR